MKLEQPHFTGDTTALAIAAQQHERREALAARGTVLFAQAQKFKDSATDDRLINVYTLAKMELEALTTGADDERDLKVDGVSIPVDKRPFSTEMRASNKNIAVSNTYDAFIEPTTGVRFVCAALVGKSGKDLASILIVTTPRDETVSDETPLDSQELIASSPLALICQDRLNGVTVLAPDYSEQQQSADAALHFKTLDLTDTIRFLDYESDRLASVMLPSE